MVTGAAGNLGVAVARAFYAAGARLILVDRAPDRLPALFPDMAGSSDHYLATSVDLLDADAAQERVQEALRRLGRIDVLVHTVGAIGVVSRSTRCRWKPGRRSLTSTSAPR